MSPKTNEPNILGRFASILGLLGTALYFTGWIYRWAYFAFFQLDVKTLDLPLQSFLIVPLQVFFGNRGTIFWSAIAALLTAILIQITLRVIKFFSTELAAYLNQVRWLLTQWSLKHRLPWLTRRLQSIGNFQPIKYHKSFIDEIVIVAWILAALFWFARLQGTADARRDAVNETSTLPAFTLITPEERLGLGRKLNDLTDNPPPKRFRVIGDRELYQQWLGRELNNKTNPDSPEIVWRFLMNRNGQIYIFPALPKNSPPNRRPPVLVIQESNNGQMMILSPEVPPARSPQN